MSFQSGHGQGMSCVALCLSSTLVVCSCCSAESAFVFSPALTHAVECVWSGVVRLCFYHNFICLCWGDGMNSSVTVQSIQVKMGLDAVSARNVAKQRNHLYFSCNAFFKKRKKKWQACFKWEPQTHVLNLKNKSKRCCENKKTQSTGNLCSLSFYNADQNIMQLNKPGAQLRSKKCHNNLIFFKL